MGGNRNGDFDDKQIKEYQSPQWGAIAKENV